MDQGGSADTGQNSFGEWLRVHRRAAGMSQRDVAEKAGVSVAAVRDIEQGRTRRPHPRSVRKLAEAVGMVRDDGQPAPPVTESAPPVPKSPPDHSGALWT